MTVSYTSAAYSPIIEIMEVFPAVHDRRNLGSEVKGSEFFFSRVFEIGKLEKPEANTNHCNFKEVKKQN